MPDIKTTLARDIEAENLDIRYDRSVKRVLGNIPLLAPITNLHGLPGGQEGLHYQLFL